MTTQYWLVKSEPETYSWTQLVKDGRTAWTGVRNFQARNNLRSMAKGDLVLFYHSVSDKRIVGVARVIKERKVGTYDVGMKNTTTDVAKEIARVASES